MQELKREQVEEQRRAAAAARQELKEEKKPKQSAAGPAPSMALRTAASLQRALSNGDDGDMFWDYGQAAGLRAGVCCTSCRIVLVVVCSAENGFLDSMWPSVIHVDFYVELGILCQTQQSVTWVGPFHFWCGQHSYLSIRQRSWVSSMCISSTPCLVWHPGVEVDVPT